MRIFRFFCFVFCFSYPPFYLISVLFLCVLFIYFSTLLFWVFHTLQLLLKSSVCITFISYCCSLNLLWWTFLCLFSSKKIKWKKKKKELILGPLLKVDQNHIFSMILKFLCFEDKSFYYNITWPFFSDWKKVRPFKILYQMMQNHNPLDGQNIYSVYIWYNRKSQKMFKQCCWWK